MRIQMLWYYYPQYQEYFRRRNPLMDGLNYDSQINCLLDDRFGWFGDMLRYLRSIGHTVFFSVGNWPTLQRAWMKEQDLACACEDDWVREIALAQVRANRPDVLWLPSWHPFLGSFVRDALRWAGKVVLWMGSPRPGEWQVEGCHALLTENPNTLRSLQHLFKHVIVTKPGFDPSILREVAASSRSGAVFAGQLSHEHEGRLHLLAQLRREGVPLEVFSSAAEEVETMGECLKGALWHLVRKRSWRGFAAGMNAGLVPGVRQRALRLLLPDLHPAVYGRRLYERLGAAQIGVNAHGDIAGGNAGNMRMFETTGMGACLVTEHTADMAALFEPDTEVVLYRSYEECVEKVRWLLSNPVECGRIAEAGQRRTLKQHTLQRVWQDIEPAFR